MDSPIKLNNEGKRIKVTIRKLTNYFSIVLLYRVMIEGKAYTEKLTVGNPIYLKSSTRKQDVDELKNAMSIRDNIEQKKKNKKLNIFKSETLLENENISLVNYMVSLSATYSGNTLKTWEKSIKHVKTFYGNMPISEINRQSVAGFSRYLKSNLSNNSANTYFQKFKQSIRQALIDELIEKDIILNTKISKNKANREFLTYEEIKIIDQTPINDLNIKNAFIFSCFTGLRFGDLQQITFDNVNDGHLNIIMQKTKDRLKIKLHPEALTIIEFQKLLHKGKKNIFYLPEHGLAYKKLKRFMKYTGIKKSISFHSARHTFATLCISSDIDIYTVSKLLGHKDVKVTQDYAKLIDKKRDEAIDKLPKI